MSLHRREEKRIRRATSEVEKGLARGRFELVLRPLLELPLPLRAPYLPGARRLFSAAVRRERALGRPELLAEWGRRLAGAGFAAEEPEVVEACWSCLWAFWERRAARGPGPTELAAARTLFEELWPSVIDRYPVSVGAAEAFLRRGAVEGEPAARELASQLEAALAEVGSLPLTARPGQLWIECVRSAGSAAEVEETVLGAWSLLPFEEFREGAAAILSHGERSALGPGAPLAGAGAGIVKAACLETMERLTDLPQAQGIEGRVEGRVWDPLSLIEPVLELGGVDLGPLREDLLLLWRAALRRSGLLDGPEARPRAEALRALELLFRALLRASGGDCGWLADWLSHLKAPDPFAPFLLPLFRRAAEVVPSASLWAAGALVWQRTAAAAAGPFAPADSWLEALARRVAAVPEELVEWLRRAPKVDRGDLLDFVAGHLEEGERILEAVWNAEPALHKCLARAYHDLLDRHRMRYDFGKLRRRLESTPLDELSLDEDFDEFLEALDQMDDVEEGPLGDRGKEIFREVYRRALPLDGRLLLFAAEELAEDEFLEAGRLLIAGEASIESCLFAVMVSETRSDFPGAGRVFFEATVARFSSEPALLARGIAHAAGEGFPIGYVRELRAALMRALASRPEAGSLEEVKRALEMSRESGGAPRKQGRRKAGAGRKEECA